MLTDQQFMQYHRQISLSNIGEEGQLKLTQAHVLIIGCGGLGSSAALYLAAAGIGRLVIADGDHVEKTNLQRQVVYRETDLESNKAQAMKAQLLALNSDLSVRAIEKHLTDTQLEMEVMLADIVLDCTDNLPTRHAINRACLKSKTPLVSGSAIGWSGQLSCYDYSDESACYRCLVDFDEMPAGSKCSDAGIMGPVVGIMGTYQALQAIKHLALNELQTGKLFLFDGESLAWNTLSVNKNGHCDVCGGS